MVCLVLWNHKLHNNNSGLEDNSEISIGHNYTSKFVLPLLKKEKH